MRGLTSKDVTEAATNVDESRSITFRLRSLKNALLEGVNICPLRPMLAYAVDKIMESLEQLSLLRLILIYEGVVDSRRSAPRATSGIDGILVIDISQELRQLCKSRSTSLMTISELALFLHAITIQVTVEDKRSKNRQ